MNVGPEALADRLHAALARAGGGTSDFDLNPEARPQDFGELRQAAVLIALRQTLAGPVVYLTKRSTSLRHHPGQVAFPGGKCEPEDPSPAAAALREAEEEIGLPPKTVSILGQLQPHETVTRFSVMPVVGLVTGDFEPVPDHNEVDEVFTVPLAHFTPTSRFAIERRRWRGAWRSYYTVPYGPYYIWGATARILRDFAIRLEA